jgi:hypothetical protein
LWGSVRSVLERPQSAGRGQGIIHADGVYRESAATRCSQRPHCRTHSSGSIPMRIGNSPGRACFHRGNWPAIRGLSVRPSVEIAPQGTVSAGRVSAAA